MMVLQHQITNRIVRETGEWNQNKARIKVNDNWNLDKLEEWLSEYEDKKVIEYLKYGWPLNSENTTTLEEIPDNQKGARMNTEQVNKYIQDELKNGSIIGPFLKNPFGGVARFSPLDTRPKQDSKDLRIILNLSYPYHGDSVNKSINTKEFAGQDEMNLSYPTVDDLVKIIRNKSENNTKCVKTFKHDLTKAYRQLWMDPKSISYLGFMFNGRMYFDMVLSMGSSAAVFCCQHTTNAITHVFKKFGYEDINYLDDLGAAEEESEAEDAFNCLGWILSTIGIRESLSKACAPAFIMAFLGILFNTITMSLTITEECLKEIEELLFSWERKTKFTLNELQQLVGKLNFATSTIRVGRVFMSRLINELANFNDTEVKYVTEDIKCDVNWWITFMEEYDRVSIMPPQNWDQPDLIFSSDTCLTGGGGWNYLGNGKSLAFHTKFPSWLTGMNGVKINELELITFIVCIKKCGKSIENRNILAYCDNQVTVDIINKGKAKNRFEQACVRELCYLTGKRNAWIKLVYLSSDENRISDSLSRWSDKRQRHRFWEITDGIEVEFKNVEENDLKFTHGW